jgi:hypothetical protein
MKMSEKQYYHKTDTIMAKDRTMISPGTPFKETDLVPATFKGMLDKGTIVEYDPTIPPPPIPQHTIGKTQTGIKRDKKKTDDVPKIGMTRKPPEVITPELRIQKETVREKLRALGARALPANARLDTLQKHLAKAEADIKSKAEEKARQLKPDKVWDADPEAIKDTSMDHLLTAYRTRCEEFNITLEHFDNVELLREKLSSQFNM